ncbi:Glycoside hydrolase/deacetylase [Glarea lozoyensis ATCC 20868]|uniref:chitin deacetylase n=1 Tax=Glarea lozoyensis (strain ATCC 20868 / MF5171) TaxID=1116229 RepID=S3E0I7_GLAL2|nr:Glycoside hydrolase/deacetylase [Glarea lozoyensis ATCC 20868]EPE32053.1 Glycoside hydrolase/deacetylase [Glarea lozoyensis ATCC 20868]
MLILLLLTLLCLAFLLAYIIYLPPRWLISYFQHRHPDVLFTFPLPPTQKTYALTIDDAPSAHTPALLSLLAHHNATATFFIIGSQISSVPNGRQILKDILSQGHEVGNHAVHDEPAISLPLPELSAQISELDAQLPKNSRGTKWFRPGSGFFSREMVKVVGELGYRTVLGNVYAHDAQIGWAGWNAWVIGRRVRRGGDVVIVHDRRSWSGRQLEGVLKGLGEKGWRGVSLGEMEGLVEEGKKGG